MLPVFPFLVYIAYIICSLWMIRAGEVTFKD